MPADSSVSRRFGFGAPAPLRELPVRQGREVACHYAEELLEPVRREKLIATAAAESSARAGGGEVTAPVEGLRVPEPGDDPLMFPRPGGDGTTR